ncbi:uncharacterized protein [Nicotiana tomentosiformis]|uniref:uncharacterized protein n=1 Tax=Nicotiana tomentosiformis TaxID=4098 RepID=UPI00388C47B1
MAYMECEKVLLRVSPMKGVMRFEKKAKLSPVIGPLDASVLFDPESTYSYVNSLFSSYLDVLRESLSVHVYVSMRVSDSIVVDRVYQSCMVTFYGYETREDLLFLDMVDFEVILCMVWLFSYNAILDCHAKTVTLAMPELPRLEWTETPALDLVPVVREFFDVFPADLPGMPPDRDIDFGIDLVPGTQPIYTLPYRMAPNELRELKEQL